MPAEKKLGEKIGIDTPRSVCYCINTAITVRTLVRCCIPRGESAAKGTLRKTNTFFGIFTAYSGGEVFDKH